MFRHPAVVTGWIPDAERKEGPVIEMDDALNEFRPAEHLIRLDHIGPGARRQQFPGLRVADASRVRRDSCGKDLRQTGVPKTIYML